MASHVVSASFDIANPAADDLAVIRAAQVRRIAAEMGQAQISRRCEEIGLSHLMSEVGIYLAAHGFHAEPCEGERWFNTDFRMYAKLAAFNSAESATRALFGGRHPLVALQTATVADPVRLAA